MVYIMQRYQIYLDPHDVSVVDEIENLTNIYRSRQIRDLVAIYASEMGKFLASQKPKTHNYTHLDKLVGFIKGDPKKKTNYARNHDDIYLSD